MSKTISKKEVLTAIVNYFKENDAEIALDEEVVVTADDILDYAHLTIDQINKKNEAAKKRAAEKRAEGDELRARIADVLTDDFQTISDIIAAVGDPDLTPGKVSSRMGQLVRAGEAHKEKVKVGDRTVMGYAAGSAPETDSDDAE